MFATDFEYDGLALSDFGMMIGSFSSSDVQTVSSGADISFHTVRPAGSDHFHFYGTKYEESFTATLQICKSPCHSDTPFLTPMELSALQRWLCRKDGYHKLHFLSDSHTDIYWNAVFSSKQINLSGQIAGLELTLYTDAPYAYRKEQTNTWTLEPGDRFPIYDTSDEVGYIYPLVTISRNSQTTAMDESSSRATSSPQIRLSNSMEADAFSMLLTGVKPNDTYILDGKNKLITAVPERSGLASRFNFHFPRIINTINQRENIFTLSQDSVPCTISFTYSPIIKTGI